MFLLALEPVAVRLQSFGLEQTQSVLVHSLVGQGYFFEEFVLVESLLPFLLFFEVGVKRVDSLLAADASFPDEGCGFSGEEGSGFGGSAFHSGAHYIMHITE